MPSNSTSSSQIQYATFSAILEADHATINRCAQRLKNALHRVAQAQQFPTAAASPISEAEAAAEVIRYEVIWRLIRHDVSEEIVMRPAFEEFMGEEGKKVVENDRKDHGDAKKPLLTLMHTPLSSPTLLAFVNSMMAELAEHMKRESGNEIPLLESILSRAKSRDLARQYARTQLLTPELRVAGSESNGAVQLVPAFTSLEDYVMAPMERFRELLGLLPEEDGGEGEIGAEETEKEERRNSRL